IKKRTPIENKKIRQKKEITPKKIKKKKITQEIKLLEMPHSWSDINEKNIRNVFITIPALISGLCQANNFSYGQNVLYNEGRIELFSLYAFCFYDIKTQIITIHLDKNIFKITYKTR
ncbi:MAG: hypothetical protein LBT05_09080, partial [Planctomycetaceae bacterium]|nr:hypothetical protein [Planctomycetaceae bacterium]